MQGLEYPNLYMLLFIVSPNFQYQYEKPFAAKKCYFFQKIFNVKSSSLNFFILMPVNGEKQ